ALKTNIFRFDANPPYMHQPGFTRGPGFPELNADASLLAAIRSACDDHGAAFLKIEPELLDTTDNRALLASYGFRPSPQAIQPPSTILLDLCGDEESILQHMKSKWRYNIRLAERKGVRVRTATRADLPSFTTLMTQTGQRDGFAVHSPAYYRAAFDLLTPNHAVFLLAEYEGQPLAALVAALAGRRAVYLWGASGEQERNRMPNHALQWAAIRWARSRGATSYDLWGIPDELGQLAVALSNGAGKSLAPDELPIALEKLPASGLWGVYRFKQGFGGQVVRTVGAWDLPLGAAGYGLYRLGLRARAAAAQIRRQLAESARPTADEPAQGRAQSDPSDVAIDVAITAAIHPEPVTAAEHWQKLLAASPNPHVLQSWEWGVVKSQTGWRAERFALHYNGEVVGAFQLLSRQLPWLPVRIGYIPKGPAINWADSDLVEATLAQVEQLARLRGCIFVKIDPDVDEAALAGRRLLHALGRRGWRYSSDQIQFKNTAFTDLTQDEETLLAAMKQKWRYNIRLAERRGVRIRPGTPADLGLFYTLYAETGRRDGFLVRPPAYYQTTWEAFLAAEADPVSRF
ncbi:MAG TPA: peptidoglycan bridge formation glycyltransferase FemA/FemB family protein, partial [Caldilineaceae bacterium]|nr:peptidoglycan bridge formation glycyltransferase FemA/FemB family protein [Caldilineaceae bacterium]